VFAVQMNDGPARPVLDDYKDDCLATRVPPGAGSFDCVGFAQTMTDMGVTAPISLEVCSTELWNMPVEEAARCKRGTKRFYPFFDPTRQVCALDIPGFKITTCHGDSGGPAIATRADGTPVEIGVTSLGDGSCNPSSPGVFTRVDQISTWVQSWINAVELGAPAPKVVIPKAHLPSLTRERAEEISAIGLEEAFGPKFAHAQEPRIQCDRKSKARLTCGVTWFQGANDYFGATDVSYAIKKNVVLVVFHFKVQWVNDQCYFHGAHPASCPVQTKRG